MTTVNIWKWLRRGAGVTLLGVIVFFLWALKRMDTSEAEQNALYARQWAQEFRDLVHATFPDSTIHEATRERHKGRVYFEDVARNRAYFQSRDKIDRVLAIESMALFRDSDLLASIELTIPDGSRVHRMNITRKAAHEFYGMTFHRMWKNEWQSNFLAKYDNPQSREEFLKKFGG